MLDKDEANSLVNIFYLLYIIVYIAVDYSSIFLPLVTSAEAREKTRQ